MGGASRFRPTGRRSRSRQLQPTVTPHPTPGHGHMRLPTPSNRAEPPVDAGRPPRPASTGIGFERSRRRGAGCAWVRASTGPNPEQHGGGRACRSSLACPGSNTPASRPDRASQLWCGRPANPELVRHPTPGTHAPAPTQPAGPALQAAERRKGREEPNRCAPGIGAPVRCCPARLEPPPALGMHHNLRESAVGDKVGPKHRHRAAARTAPEKLPMRGHLLSRST